MMTLRFAFGAVGVVVGTASSNLPGYAVPGLILAAVGLYFAVSAWAAMNRRDAESDLAAFRRRYHRGEWYMPPRGSLARSSAEMGVAIRRLIRSGSWRRLG